MEVQKGRIKIITNRLKACYNFVGETSMNKELETWHFGIDNDKLVALVLFGEKSATTSLYTKGELPVIGEKSILAYENGLPACIVETKKVIVTKFRQVTEEMAKLEGEGDKTLNYWKNVHYKYFKSIDANFDENTKIVFEVFEKRNIL